ncbi:MAG: hypothetical protein B5M53_08120 [Candidatus Cloacimonas sp. 4484_209]|nr:MAG: hypothetical protein B5M53_08120 [Candidatus Cloacimonas sp. 4484_209]
MRKHNFIKIKYILVQVAIFLVFLTSVISGEGKTGLQVGETFLYDVTFSGVLKGKTVITFYGRITYFTRMDTIYSRVAEPLENQTVIDSTKLKSLLPNSLLKKPDTTLNDSALVPESIMVVKAETTNIYYITYDTKFIGNIYNLHADIYTRDDFFPLLIETKISRTGKLSVGHELFFPEKKTAIFSQSIEKGEIDVDTIIRSNPIQDITTLPFYFSKLNLQDSDTFHISLPQGEYKLVHTQDKTIEVGEGEDYISYKTSVFESQPSGLKVYVCKKDKIPIKVNIDTQKIKMLLIKRKINKTSLQSVKNEQLISNIRKKLKPIINMSDIKK